MNKSRNSFFNFITRENQIYVFVIFKISKIH